MKANPFCRICGYEHSEPPWGEDGQCPDYLFCPCCGVEAGYEDYTLVSIRDYRGVWLSDGAPWAMPNYRPAAWEVARQLENIPRQYS